MRKAFVTQVPFGESEIEGLMDEEGNYYVAVTQVAQRFLASLNNPSKDVKALLGKDSQQFLKLKTELNPNPVNAISLPQLERVIVELSIKGNKSAQELMRSLVGLSLHQLFSDAFGVKFEKEERQSWLTQRERHLRGYHSHLTRWLQADGCTKGKDYAIAVNKFKICARLPVKSVDEYNAEELLRLNDAEVSYHMARKLGHSHDDSLRYL